MATTYEQFLPKIRLRLSGCPELLMIEAIEDAVIRFCEDSLIWRVNITPSDVVAGFDEYVIDPGTGSRVIVPTYVLYDKKPLGVRTASELDMEDSGWRTADPGVPTAYIVPRPDLIRFNREPEDTITDGIKIGCAIKPLRGQTSFDDDQIYQDWEQGIVAGALAARKADVEKKWSADGPNEVTSLLNKFNFYCQRARASAEKGSAYKTTTVKPRVWI